MLLASEHGLDVAQIVDVEVGIPKVIEGMLTKNDPSDLQSAQLSVPFSLAMALSLGRTRGARAAIRREDYETALASPAVRELSRRIRCVVDPEIEAATNTEEVPARVTLKLADGRELVARVAHPRVWTRRTPTNGGCCSSRRDASGESPLRIWWPVRCQSSRDTTAAFKDARRWKRLRHRNSSNIKGAARLYKYYNS